MYHREQQALYGRDYTSSMGGPAGNMVPGLYQWGGQATRAGYSSGVKQQPLSPAGSTGSLQSMSPPSSSDQSPYTTNPPIGSESMDLSLSVGDVVWYLNGGVCLSSANCMGRPLGQYPPPLIEPGAIIEHFPGGKNPISQCTNGGCHSRRGRFGEVIERGKSAVVPKEAHGKCRKNSRVPREGTGISNQYVWDSTWRASLGKLTLVPC
ncbi:hypothetical protein Btru_015541 [Bulinus truncatus]|nr:hypothetical protein Btru_015541 [Bulinus truncatus]